MKKNHYISGQWNFVCDSCGQKLKSGESRQRWDGFQVCSECWEPRHPQDFVRARQDRISVPWSRPQTDLVFLDDGNRSVSDTITLTEICSIQPNLGYADQFNVDDAGQDYIDATYFAEDYIESLGIYITVGKNLSENITLTESGTIVQQDYVDITYFASDFIGTSASF